MILKILLFGLYVFINLLADCSVINSTQTSISEQHVFLKETARKIGKALDELGEDELVILKTQKIYNVAEYIQRNFDEEKQVQKLSKRISQKTESFLFALSSTFSRIDMFLREAVEKPYFDQACSMKAKYMIDRLVSGPLPPRPLNLTKTFLENYNRNPMIKQQYIIPSADYGEMTHVYNRNENLGCYRSDDPLYQNIYLKTVEKKSKQIVLMIDIGSSLSINQLEAAKLVARHIISSLSPSDQIGLIAVNANGTSIFSDACKKNKMVYATNNSKRLMMKFVDFLGQSKAATNHSLGFKTAFNLLNKKERSDDALIIYVSKGLLSSLDELKQLLTVIAEGQQAVLPRVLINTCLLVDGEKPLLFDERILKEVAEQNFTKHNIPFHGPKKNMSLSGVLESVSLDINMDSPVRRLITSNSSQNDDVYTFSLPKWDRSALTVSISKKVELQSGVFGVIGLDIYLEDFSEDIVYYHRHSRSYAFLIDTNGYVLMHPSLKLTGYSNIQTLAIDIKNFEMDNEFKLVRKYILKNPKGITKVDRQTTKGLKQIQYTWQRVDNAPFIVVIVSDLSRKPLGVYRSNTTVQGSNLVHHLYYLVNSKQFHPQKRSDEQNICRYLNQLTFHNASSLFLSAWCFQSPFKYLLSPESNVNTYSAYLSDVSKPFLNHGFRDDGIQYDISALMRVLVEWEKNILKSKLSKYVVRKYVATSSGLLVVFPGSVIEHNLDPVRRSWFSLAVQNPEKIILSSPYLDAGWAGYIVTYSQKLVYHLKGSSVTPTSVVMAMDLTLGYFYTLLLDNLPFCTLNDVRNISNEGKMKCFLMDDKGYILAHPSALDMNKSPSEGLHITHKSYPLVASDILNHEGFVKKLLCTDFATNTIQRFYKFNTSQTEVFTNKISADQCVRYQIVSIPGTNVFLGVVNTTCQPTAFCPCSTLDRQCMNCNRMAQTDCECPCECSFDSDVCDHTDSNISLNLKSSHPCPNYAESFAPGYKPSYYYSLLAKVKPCSNYDCKLFTTYKDCMGTAGCEWCTTDQDGVTPLAVPECTVQTICFNGVRNSPFPYGDIIGTGFSNVELGSTSNSMLVISVVFAIIFSLGLMGYCYINRSQMNQMDNAQPLGLYTCDKRYKKFGEEPPTDHNNGLLQSVQEVPTNVQTVSPYRMSVGYCRPPKAESDHGYSTMSTCQEDADHNELPMPEPQTVLNPHQIIVPVTVHMVDK